MQMLGREQVLSTSQCPLPQHRPAFLLQPWQRAIITAGTAGLPATDGSPTRLSIACPELDFVPIELWGMEGSTALGRSPVAQHAKQAGPAGQCLLSWSPRDGSVVPKLSPPGHSRDSLNFLPVQWPVVLEKQS